MSNAVDAIRSLCGPVEFVIREGDLANIEWHTEVASPPTPKQIEAELARLSQVEAERSANRQSALRKMCEASGLTPDELAALGL